MTTFKVGDKVRVTAGDSESSKLLDGRICTVRKDFGYAVELVEELEVRDEAGGLHYKELELVNEDGEKPFLREGRIYRRRNGVLGNTEFRLNGGVTETRAEFEKSWRVVTENGWTADHPDFTAKWFEVIEDEARTPEQIKMDTVREAGERRRQKALAHIAELENVIRRRNAEIERFKEENLRLGRIAASRYDAIEAARSALGGTL